MFVLKMKLILSAWFFHRKRERRDKKKRELCVRHSISGDVSTWRKDEEVASFNLKKTLDLSSLSIYKINIFVLGNMKS